MGLLPRPARRVRGDVAARAARAWKDGLFDNEVVKVNDLGIDETIRPTTTPESLAGLRLAFDDDHWSRRFPEIEWKVTAGNSSP